MQKTSIKCSCLVYLCSVRFQFSGCFCPCGPDHSKTWQISTNDSCMIPAVALTLEQHTCNCDASIMHSCSILSYLFAFHWILLRFVTNLWSPTWNDATSASAASVEVFTLPHVFHASPHRLAQTPCELPSCQDGTDTTVTAAQSPCGVCAESAHFLLGHSDSTQTSLSRFSICSD